MARLWIAIFVVAVGVRAGGAAEPEREPSSVVLRMAAIAPEGTSWARLLVGFADEVDRATQGRVRIKWLLGGVAGDELTTLEEARRGELAGLAGAAFCQRVAPSLHAIEVAGLVQNDAEAGEVLRQLRPQLDDEARAASFRFLALSAGFGHRVLFSREPVRSMAALRQLRVWIYDLDELERAQLPLMGLDVVPLPILDAGRAYDRGRIDGFISIPWAAVAYRYGVKARYFTDLNSGFLPGCMIVSRATFERLDAGEQAALATAGAHLEERGRRLGIRDHQQLLAVVFPREGLRAVPMSDSFRAEFVEAARAASARLGPRLAPLPLVRRVSAILAAIRGSGTRTARAPPRQSRAE